MRIEVTDYDVIGQLYTARIDDQRFYIGFDAYDDQVVEVFDYATITYQPEMSQRVQNHRDTLDAAIATYRRL